MHTPAFLIDDEGLSLGTRIKKNCTFGTSLTRKITMNLKQTTAENGGGYETNVDPRAQTNHGVDNSILLPL